MLNIFGHSHFADARQAISQVTSGRAVLFDVRTPGEFQASHAVGARNLPLEAITAGHLPDTPPYQTIYLYCNSGSRSRHAQTILSHAGFSSALNLGGLHHWRSAGGAVT